MNTPSPQTGDSPAGFAYATAAYLLWGFLPLYMKPIDHIPAVEVIAHRVLWSVPIAGVILILLGRTGDLVRALKTPRMVGMAAVTAALISINWGVYVWAIAAERTVEAAIGYYINPLVNVVLATLFLGERLTRLQALAIALAATAVAILTFRAGGLPWVSLVLAFSFGLYGFFRKTLPVGAATPRTRPPAISRPRSHMRWRRRRPAR